MSTIVTRSAKGASLTHTEMDNNFTNLNNDKYQSGDTASFLSVTFTQSTGAPPMTVSSTTLVNNLNVDKLDNQEGSYYLDYTNFTNTPTEGNATVTVSAGTGLSGGGTFTAGQVANSTITFNLDFSELTDMTADISGTTQFILQNGTTESRKAASEIKLSAFNNDLNEVLGDFTVAGNLTVLGNTVSVDVESLSVSDNMIYLNANSSNTTTLIDIGIAANYNDDGFYSHTGIFRDASDNYWKVFDNYSPEPDEALEINVGHASYNDANFQAGVFKSTVATGTAPLIVSSNTVVTNLNSDLLDGQSGPYYLAYGNFTGTPTIGNATITLAAGTNLTGGGDLTTNQTGNETITFNHATITTTPTTDSNTLSHSDSFDAITSVTYNNGHITGLETTTYTLPAGAVPNNATITITAGTDLSTGGNFTTDQATPETITINHANITRSDPVNGTVTLSHSGTFVALTGVTTNARGHVTAVQANTFTLPAGAVPNDATITITAGTDLSTGGNFTTDQATPETITINHSNITRTDPIDGTATLTHGGTFLAITGITSSATGHLTAVQANTFTMPAGTNLSYTASTRLLSSSTGTNVTLPAVVASGNSGLMIGSDKAKLDGIAAGAQVNVATNLGTSANTITRTVTSSTGTNVVLPAANTTQAGVMTSADRTKLDGVAAGAQVNVATNLTNTASGTSLTVNSSTGTNTSLPAATTVAWGVMTDEDKTKLDSIAAGAQVNVATNLSYTASTRLLSSSTGTNVTLPAVVASGNSGLMIGSDKAKLDGIASGAQPGTVTSVAAGSGMNFTSIATSGSVTMGTPSTLTAATTNAVTSTSHTHAITGFLPLTGGTLTGTTTVAALRETVTSTSGTGVYTISCTTGNVFWRTLTGNTTIAFSNTPATGQVQTVSIILQQNATGGYIITWPTTNFYWAENVEPPAATAANDLNMYTVQIINNAGTVYYFASLSIRNAS